MTALSFAQSEIIDELRLIDAGRKRLAVKRERITSKRRWLADEWAKLLTVENELLAEESETSAEDRELTKRETLVRERLQNLTDTENLASVPLVFDDTARTIRWDGGSVKLGGKPYKFVKTLYFAKNQRMTVSGIAHKVWHDPLVSPHTIHVAFYRLIEKVTMQRFPYKIIHVFRKEKITETRSKRTGEIMRMTFPEMDGFKLLAKK